MVRLEHKEELVHVRRYAVLVREDVEAELSGDRLSDLQGAQQHAGFPMSCGLSLSPWPGAWERSRGPGR